ncbi:hypothetical protein MPH_03499 [Macrophomina phaseolina MS6]|uniref:Major facilitator superfamily domain general substrate transporter n=1 Tax=Macrophomina phaseolina (strain MS6) TaxID=1126212 RepID=K2RWU9_MACPH|nr:hypothetical protein MPH_03499 [Macrophomina phaseolina MS6]
MGKSSQNSSETVLSEPESFELSASPIPNPPPDGGLQAWLQVLGAHLLFFSSSGIVSAFGAFQTFYESHYLTSSSPSAISWIGTIQGFLLIVNIPNKRIFNLLTLAGYWCFHRARLRFRLPSHTHQYRSFLDNLWASHGQRIHGILSNTSFPWYLYRSWLWLSFHPKCGRRRNILQQQKSHRHRPCRSGWKYWRHHLPHRLPASYRRSWLRMGDPGYGVHRTHHSIRLAPCATAARPANQEARPGRH